MNQIELFSSNTPLQEKFLISALLIVLIVIFLFFVSKLAKEMIINSVLGFGLVAILKYFGLWKFAFTLFVYLIILFGGIPGVALIYIFELLGIKF